MPLPFPFDYKNPDYISVFDWRKDRLERIRQDPSVLSYLYQFYQDNPANFIIDWGCTSDPRNPGKGLPATIPFLLFPKQEDWVNATVESWLKQEPMLTVKSREMGVTWLMVALACTLCIFRQGLTIGFGSRKEDLVDKLGDPDCIFYKVRQFMRLLPKEFRGKWNEREHAPYMKIFFPHTESVIKGEGGRSIGRGGRASIYFVDEAAWLPHPEDVEASLSQTTNSRQDVSTPKGMTNAFARKRFAGNIKVFEMRWQDDPRKDYEWYERQCKFLDDPVLVAQELDLNFTASQEGIVIPAEWINACVDAHIKLGIEPSGIRQGALDVADEGRDKNAQISNYSFLTYRTDIWSGIGGDIYKTTEKAISICDEEGYDVVSYDADGLGAGVRGDARVLNEKRKAKQVHNIIFNPFNGSGGVLFPKQEVYKRRATDAPERLKAKLNIDFFENFKAQAWWHVRNKVKNTYFAVIEKREYNTDDIVSISSSCTHVRQLVTEISQPTCSWGENGKMVINKKPDGALSPNLADAFVIVNAPRDTRKGFYDTTTET